MKRRGFLSVLLLAMLFVPSTGGAFTADEHRWLTHMALGVAFDTGCSGETEHDPWCRFLETSLASHPDPVATVTVAVDWTRAPGELVPAGLAGLPAGRAGDGAALASLDETARAIRRRPWSWFAKHRNSSHFQDGAAEAFGAWHRAALEAAAGGHWRRAVALDAIALHSLQDFLAAGHFITSRSGLIDAPAGGLHDRVNRSGLPAQVHFEELWDGRNLDDALRSIERRAEDEPCPSSSPRGWSFEDLQDIVRAGGARTFYGDHELCKAAARSQAVALILAATRSLLETRTAGSTPVGSEATTALCFRPRSAIPVDEALAEREQLGVWCDTWCNPESESKIRWLFRFRCTEEECEKLASNEEELSKSRYRSCSVSAPWAAVLTRRRRDASRPCWEIEDRPAIQWLTKETTRECEFEEDQDRTTTTRECDPKDLCDPEIDGIALSVAVTPVVVSNNSSEGVRIEVGILDAVTASSRLRRRGKDGRLLEDQKFFEGDATVLGTVGLRYEERPEFRSLGLVDRFWGAWKLLDLQDPTKGELDAVLGLSFGWDQLENQANTTTRFQYGVFFGLALGPALGELGVEYGYDLLEGGRADRTVKYTLGVRFEIASTWFRRLIH